MDILEDTGSCAKQYSCGIVVTVPVRVPVSDSMRSTNYFSLTVVLICWMTVRLKRLQRLN